MSLLIQNVNGCFVTVDAPRQGSMLRATGYSGGPSQIFELREYPGTDPKRQGGVVSVIVHVQTRLVVQAGNCTDPVSLQPLEPYNRAQLWSHPLGSGPFSLENLNVPCMLDLYDDECGGVIQTYPENGSDAQKFALLTLAQAAAVATAPAEAPAFAG